MYFLLGVSLIFAVLLIVNLVLVIFTSVFWRIMSSRLRRLSINVRGQVLFGLCILPATVALVVVSVFVIPGYLRHEPAESGEVVSGKLGFIAIAGMLGVLVALYRFLKSWLVTRRLTSNWLRDSVEIRLPGIDLPIRRFRHQFPVIAVVGILSPKMFVAEQVLELLDQKELAAAANHEYGHLRANDNLKWTFVRVCRDLLILPIGKSMDREWAENAESAADAYAANSGRSTALDLASALVKIARIVPAHTTPAMPAGAFFVEEHNADITSRVRRLVHFSSEQYPIRRSRVLGLATASYLWIALLAILAVLPLLDPGILSSTHDAVELFVHTLQ